MHEFFERVLLFMMLSHVLRGIFGSCLYCFLSVMNKAPSKSLGSCCNFFIVPLV